MLKIQWISVGYENTSWPGCCKFSGMSRRHGRRLPKGTAPTGTMRRSDLSVNTMGSMSRPTPGRHRPGDRRVAGFPALRAGARAGVFASILALGAFLSGCGNSVTPLDGGGTTPTGPLPKAHIQLLPPSSSACGSATVAASSLLVLAGDTVSFDPSDSEGNLVKYVWDFRYDGLTLTSDFLSSTPDQATTSYPFPGTFTVALEVTDEDGNTDLTTFKVFVGDAGATLQLIPSALDFGTPKVGETVPSQVYVFNSGIDPVNVIGVESDRPEVIPGTLPAILPVNCAEAVPIPVDFQSFRTDTLTGDIRVHVDGLSDLVLGYTGTAQSGFARVGPMNVARSFHTATRLADGRVLIVGGQDATGRPLDSVEIYDPDTRTFLPGPSLSDVSVPEPGVPVIGPRSHHTATLLADGKVLVAGGDYYDATLGVTRVHGTGVVYDPARGLNGEWIFNFRLADPRTQHTAVRVVTATGQERVLLIGGKEDASAADPLATVEVLAGNGGFVGTGNLSEPRLLHASVALDDHRVLIAGGIGPNSNGAADGAEIFDLDTFGSTVVPMAVPTYDLTLNRVDTGAGNTSFLAVGGGQTTLVAVGSVRAYNPTAFTLQVGRLADARRRHAAVDLGDGRGLLVVGGIGPTNGPVAGAEIVSAGGQAVSPVDDAPAVRRSAGHRATLLEDGTVLITGGVAPSLGLAVNTAELYVPEP